MTRHGNRVKSGYHGNRKLLLCDMRIVLQTLHLIYNLTETEKPPPPIIHNDTLFFAGIQKISLCEKREQEAKWNMEIADPGKTQRTLSVYRSDPQPSRGSAIMHCSK